MKKYLFTTAATLLAGWGLVQAGKGKAAWLKGRGRVQKRDRRLSVTV